LNYEFIERRKEEISEIPYDYVLKFQCEYAKYIQEKIKENEEKFNNR